MILEFVVSFIVLTIVLNLTIWPGFPLAMPPQI